MLSIVAGFAGVDEIAAAQDDRPHAFGGGLAVGGLHLGPDPALAGDRAVRRVLVHGPGWSPKT